MQISQIASRIAPSAQGAPNELIRQAVIDATAEFCSKTRAWNEIQDATLVLSDVNDYEVDLPSGAQPLSIEDVWCGVFRLTPLTMQALQAVMPNWQTATGPRPLYYNADFNWPGFRVYPTPVTTDPIALRIRGSFMPTEASESLPDFFWNRYREVIASGAKARLLMLPAVPWANPALAAYHSSIFEPGITSARIEVLHGRVSGTVTVPSRRFF